MKYMKLGTRADTFYTEEATRTVLSDVPTDLIIQINNTKYLLHKFPLLLKCGLLQRLYSDSSPSSISSTTMSTATTPIFLPDFPGGEAAFELCAKFCYNISITLSAHNFIPAFSAATFLIMTESVSHPNLLPKLQSFFLSCILPNWKDSIITLSSFCHSLPSFSDPTIISPLIDSIVSKILVPPSKVTWSFTYSRQLQSVPKDWWTEDIADLDLNHFRLIISSIRPNKMFPPALIGEALHVYAVKNLPDPNQITNNWSNLSGKYRQVLEVIVSLIPVEVGSVSGGFLMRLLKIAILVEASTSVKAELVRRAGRQLDEVSIRDLVFSYRGRDEELALVEAVVKSFIEGLRRKRKEEREQEERMGRVAKVFDEYLGTVARDVELRVDKFVELAELVPLGEREEHDGLYRAIDTFLEEHPNLSKAERKQVCQLIDCKKLSSGVRSEAIANDNIPLRRLVQLLFVEQERLGRISGSHGFPTAPQTREETWTSRKQEIVDEHRHQEIEEMIEDGRDEGFRLGMKGEGSGSNPLPKVRGKAQVQKKKMDRKPG